MAITGNASITEGADTLASTSAYVPALDLDFYGSTSLDARVNFSRASTATRINASGLIELVANDVHRIEYDPITRLRRGLMIEGARTNLWTYSEQIDQAAWSKNNGLTITENNAISPDGAQTADLLVAHSTGLNAIYRLATGAVNGTFHIVSFFAKAGSKSVIQIGLNSALGGTTDRRANFDLANGVLGTVDAGTSAYIRPMGNGWYRCSATFTATATSSSSNVVISLQDSTTAAREANSTAGDILFWGAQLEATAFSGFDVPSSYIPTAGAQATRAADGPPAVTGSNFSAIWNAIEGTMLLEWEHDSPSGFTPFVSANDGGGNNRVTIYANTSDPTFIVTAGGATQAVSTMGSQAIDRLARMAVAYRANDFACAFNGGAVTNDTSGSVPTVTQLQLGAEGGASASGARIIRRLAYYSARLPDAALRTLTALQGAAAITEGGDTASGTGAVHIGGVAAITEDADTVTATGAVRVKGTASITEGDDVAAGTGEVGVPLVTPRGRIATPAAALRANRIARAS